MRSSAGKLLQFRSMTRELSVHPGRKKNKYAPDYLSEDLKAQWARDRAKKAENKQRRKQARMLAALDITAPKKGGKKAHKLIMAAFNQLSQTTNHPMDMSKIESLMREFVANIGGRKTISLPPMDKGTRKAVHELATAFNLKSLSKGGGLGRYVTLTKTTWSGTINEGKVKALMKRAARESGRGFGGQKGGRPQIPAHREGDEVGKVNFHSHVFAHAENAAGSASGWGEQYWIQDAVLNGLGRRCQNWRRNVRWDRGTSHSCY